MGKIKLPETSYFYALAMKRSAELKRIANNPRCPMPDSVCKFCGAKATETHPIPGPGDVSFLVFECGSSVFSDGDSPVQCEACKLSQRDQEIERLRKALRQVLSLNTTSSKAADIINQALAPR